MQIEIIIKNEDEEVWGKRTAVDWEEAEMCLDSLKRNYEKEAEKLEAQDRLVNSEENPLSDEQVIKGEAEVYRQMEEIG